MIRAHDPLRTRRERFAAGIAAATTVIAGALLTIPIANAAMAVSVWLRRHVLILPKVAPAQR